MVEAVAQLFVNGLVHPVFALLIAAVFKIAVIFHKVNVFVDHIPHFFYTKIIETGISQHLGCPTALRSREEVQRITELRCCQSGPLQIVAISLINDNAIGHFHDAAFDALQLIARTRQLYQQEEVYHRMYGSLTLPHPYRLYKYLVETGSLTKHNRFTRLACHATQRTGRGTGTYEGLGMNGELLHTRLITENTAFAAFAARVNGKNGQLAAVFLQYMQAKYINRGTFTGTGHTTDTHTDGVARIGQTLLYHLLRHSLVLRFHTFHQCYSLAEYRNITFHYTLHIV